MPQLFLGGSDMNLTRLAGQAAGDAGCEGPSRHTLEHGQSSVRKTIVSHSIPTHTTTTTTLPPASHP